MPGRQLEHPAVHLDRVASWIPLVAERRHDAVDGNPALAQVLLGAAPRGQAGTREELLETLLAHDPTLSRANCPASPTSSSNSSNGGRSSRFWSPKCIRNSRVVR